MGLNLAYFKENSKYALFVMEGSDNGSMLYGINYAGGGTEGEGQLVSVINPVLGCIIPISGDRGGS